MARPTKRKRKAVPWTKAQEADLCNGVSISGISWFRRHCDRTANAIYAKLRREHGAGGLTRGAYTFWQLARTTGYSRPQLKRAQGALGQKWKRLGPRGAHIITEEQQTELVVWLSHDYWSKKLRRYGCSWCTTETRAAFSVGLCARCYYRHRRRCAKLGLPLTTSGQLAMLRKIQRVGWDTSGVSVVVVRDAVTRLEAGLVLPEGALDWLALLAE
jgi:hypothetical protein